MTWAGQQAVTEGLEKFIPFNEVLALGYYESSDIGVSTILFAYAV